MSSRSSPCFGLTTPAVVAVVSRQLPRDNLQCLATPIRGRRGHRLCLVPPLCCKSCSWLPRCGVLWLPVPSPNYHHHPPPFSPPSPEPRGYWPQTHASYRDRGRNRRGCELYAPPINVVSLGNKQYIAQYCENQSESTHKSPSQCGSCPSQPQAFRTL